MADPEDNAKGKGDGDSAPAAGERLAGARRTREISLAEIAKGLHLDEPKVRALERNDFEALGAPVFAKGYLRKYAELVGIPEDEVIADYYRLNRSAGAPPLITKRPRQVREIPTGPLIGALLLVLVVALAAWLWSAVGSEWWAARRGAPVGSPPVASDLPAERATPAAPAVDGTDDAPVPSPDPATESASGESVGNATREVGTPAETMARDPGPVAEGDLGLRLAFTGDCWTEVTDGNGQRLYFGLGTSGDEVTVSGEPPLNVLLGNSDNVSVFVDGSAYAIPASARRGDTARLTLTAR